jgi:hypothetical protein
MKMSESIFANSLPEEVVTGVKQQGSKNAMLEVIGIIGH